MCYILSDASAGGVGLRGKESACQAGDSGSISGSGRSPGEGDSYPLRYSCLENSVDRGTWWATIHGIAESDTTGRLTPTQNCMHLSRLMNCTPHRVAGKNLQTIAFVFILFWEDCPEAITQVPFNLLFRNAIFLFWVICPLKKIIASLKDNFTDFPGGLEIKNLPANAGDMGLILVLTSGRSHMLWSN